MLQIETLSQNIRLFQSFAFWHCAANWMSAGQLWLGRQITHARNISNKADRLRVQSLCSARNTRPGILKFKLATMAPNPNDTSRIGSAQHSKVLLVMNRVSHFKYALSDQLTCFKVLTFCGLCYQVIELDRCFHIKFWR